MKTLNKTFSNKPFDNRRGARHKYVALALAFLLGSLLCSSAVAQGRGGHHGGGHHHGAAHYQGHHHGHGRAHVGIAIGAPLFWPGYGYRSGWYGDPYDSYGFRGYAYRPVPVPPPVYVERNVLPPSSLWYFCGNPEGYYPYVKHCSTAWRTVLPQTVIR